jgi:hypothetical protein
VPKNGNKFTQIQLLELGFRRDASGSWSKDNLNRRDPKSPARKRKQNSRRPSEGKNAAQERGKASHREGDRYRIIIHTYRTRLIDFSNAYSKAIEDTLTHEGLIPDDSPKYCDQPLIIQTIVKLGEERTIIEVLKYNINNL